MSLNRVHQKRMLWLNGCEVQGKISSHILKKSPIALTYSRIVEGVTESKRSFMFLTSKNQAPGWEAQTSQFFCLWCDALADRTPASPTPRGCSNHCATQGRSGTEMDGSDETYHRHGRTWPRRTLCSRSKEVDDESMANPDQSLDKGLEGGLGRPLEVDGSTGKLLDRSKNGNRKTKVGFRRQFHSQRQGKQ